MRPINNSIDESIINYFNTAVYSIWVNVTWFTHKEIFNALLEAKDRGLEVKLSIEDDEINQKCGIEYERIIGRKSCLYKHRKAGNGKNHEKYAIIDDKILIYGSFNYTYNASQNSLESVIVFLSETDHTAKILEDYKQRFLSLNTNPNVTLYDYDAADYAIATNVTAYKMEILLLEAQLSTIEIQCQEFNNFLSWIIAKFDIEFSDLLLLKNSLLEKLSILRFRLTQQESDKIALEELQSENQKTKERLEQLRESPPSEKFEEHEELKKYYREAIILAHPDKYANDESLYNKATTITQKLNEAKANGDIETIKEILNDLKSGFAFLTDYTSINQTEQLIKIINSLKRKINQATEKLAKLEQNKFAHLYKNRDDVNLYMAQLKTNLEAEIYGLREEMKKYKNYE